jgi:hypothetical protein
VTIGGSWTAKYNQVTVPIKNEHDLGRAYKRLRVNVTATSPGTSGFLGSFAIGGYGPLTQSDGGDSDCAQQEYFTQGTLGTDSPIEALFLDQPHKFQGLTLPFATFVLGRPGPAAPSTYTDSLGGQNSTDRELSNVITDVPDQELELENNGHNDVIDFGGFQADFDTEILRGLERQKVVQIPDLVRSGEKDCGSDTDDLHTESCTIKWSFKFTPKLTRHSLYRTKRDYAR